MHPGILAAGGTAALLLLLLGVLAAGTAGVLFARRLELTRSVMVHAPAGRAWEFVRHLPALHERHGKARELCPITAWSLRHGDGAHAGSVWRAHGDWDGSPYWADLEVVRVDPGRQLAFALRRDSLGTHRGLKTHLGTLLLETAGSDATKLTWCLRAELRGPRLILARMRSRSRLQARLFDQGLRSLKVEIDNSAREGTETDRSADEASTVAPAPPPPPARIPRGPETSA
ncbi:MAG TPA: SRPBCC family protein [Candidatus Polarisedimenticolia bacterium]|nr:SRPBCC family protein [Candidatus Polarisedimenticolia bacterium]